MDDARSKEAGYAEGAASIACAVPLRLISVEDRAVARHWKDYSMIGQGATQTSSSTGQLRPSIRPGGDANITALACAPYDSILSAPLPAASPINPGDPRRPSAKAPHPNEVLKCPRCDSPDTKFCYYNNYSLTQPRYFCKNCKRYWTAGGALRNVPVGGGLRKNKRSKLKLAAAAAADAEAFAAQALAVAGGQPQNQVKAAGDPAPQKVDNRTTISGGISSSQPHVGEDSTIAACRYDVEHMVDKNGVRTAAPTLPHHGGSLYSKEDSNAGAAFLSDPAHVPQFYSSYAASLPIQFGNAAVSGGAVTGYAVNYSFFTPDPNENASNQDCSQVPGEAGQPRGEVKPDKDAAEGTANSYDWQLIPEGLFSGSGSSDSNFLGPSFTPLNTCEEQGIGAAPGLVEAAGAVYERHQNGCSVMDGTPKCMKILKSENTVHSPGKVAGIESNL
ncbi:hypothetical protein GOP47_0014736 [Adiantum capillus-veneris]|uniref:Dof-type domain-containing protein n=1 Tax=Adiantum capillus-veneris TaxID=13818 RepID=A0A9D4UM24_ADICA|nr:hypothetical protein GOP47_0014736 [Adiantum capillus-veneris]